MDIAVTDPLSEDTDIGDDLAMQEYTSDFDLFYHQAKNGMANTVGTQNFFKEYFGNEYFRNFKDRAYQNPAGVSIARNPWSGEVEMFIAGNRSFKDWKESTGVWLSRNKLFTDGLLNDFNVGQKSDDNVYAEAMDLVDLAREYGVTKVYAHSAGVAKAAWFPQDEFQVVGINGATSLASHDIVNIRGKGFFDKMIAKKLYKPDKSVEVAESGFHDITKKVVVTKKKKEKRKYKDEELDASLEAEKSKSKKFREAFNKLKGRKPQDERIKVGARTIYRTGEASKERSKVYSEQELTAKAERLESEAEKFREQAEYMKNKYSPRGELRRRRLASSSSVTKKNHKKKGKRKSKTKSKKGRSR